MMAKRRGFTLVETLLSIALFGTMLATVLSSFVTGQSAFFTSEAYLQSSQSARNALDIITQDLAGAQIRNYFNGQDPAVQAGGNGKVFVKFRRMNPAIVDANGNRVWDNQIFMYLWCPQGAATPPWTTINVCTNILNAAGSQSQPALPGELLLVRAAASNPGGDSTGQWVRDRVLINGSERQGQVVRFLIALTQANGAAVPQATAATGGCTSLSPGNECITPFTVGSPPQLPTRVGLTLQARATAMRGRQVTAAGEPGNLARVQLRNPQD